MRQLVGAAPHRQSRGGGVTFGVSVLTQQINNSSESADRLRQLLHAWRPDRYICSLSDRTQSSVPAALSLCIPATVRIQYSADIHVIQ